MGKDTSKASDHRSTNALDDVAEQGLSIDAYLAFGGTPKAVPNPPREGDVAVFRVKVECIGETKKRRTDGEMRYTRHLQILSVARDGQELPPDANENQPGLYDDDGNPSAEASGTEGDPQTIGEVIEGQFGGGATVEGDAPDTPDNDDAPEEDSDK